VDRVLFCFFFSFSARKSLTSFSRIAADCIVIWHAFKTWLIAELSGLFPISGPKLYKSPATYCFLNRFLPPQSTPRYQGTPLTMAAINCTRSKDVISKRKLMWQKQCRRKTSLMKKAYEYSKMCSADVCVGIRIRETGQVHILSADTSGFWAFLGSQLVCLQLWLWWKKRLTYQELLLSNPNKRDRPGSRKRQCCFS
jgi:hypothetical protein